MDPQGSMSSPIGNFTSKKLLSKAFGDDQSKVLLTMPIFYRDTKLTLSEVHEMTQTLVDKCE